MVYEMPFESIARDSMDGKRVAVFCDNQSQADRCKQRIAGKARELGAHKVVCPRRDRRVDIDGNHVYLFLVGGDGRGYSADVVYLSELARMQHEWAALMGGEVR